MDISSLVSNAMYSNLSSLVSNVNIQLAIGADVCKEFTARPSYVYVSEVGRGLFYTVRDYTMHDTDSVNRLLSPSGLDLSILSAVRPGEREFDSGEVHFAMIDALGSGLQL
ncbi:hypothetical protein BC832DRAFT_542010 [Gaertneriomyces semiglobifer]|nr:hypothetical protein BC832DRAFT_542010 [Gaertneriomyces semiglobifer]